ncbi:YheC/D like ATP-grasp [Alteribacillus persepolensis]|uniref:YheC/D like ATP-grasp n=1 Tax=Alteribacillus persepolensis TaxID=568899 RepID=A0A1G8C0Q5_9BACI|nr:YheC/YheD family protein [Alteribacillus persepolensis]SDH39057.1 YheC/D like ATP-grasp [Alteribacillus persepolensis]
MIDNQTSLPVIGVLCRNSVIKNLLFQKDSLRTRSIQRAGEDINSDVYFFGSKDIQENEERVLGTYFHPLEKKWLQKYFRLPGVIFRMGGQFKRTNIPAYFRSRPTVVLNLFQSFDKLEQFRFLRKHPKLRACLPETKTLSLANKKQLFSFIHKHRHVYVKAVFGFQSKHIMKISKRKKGVYQYKYYQSKMRTGKAGKTKLLKKMKKYFKSQSLIIQKAVPLMNKHRRHFDIRVELNRTRDGTLKAAGYCIRQSKKGHFTTKQSGKYPLAKYFRNKLNYSSKDVQNIIDHVDKLAKTAYEAIEEKYGPIAEMGIDMLLDRKGKFRIIECNLCSGKRTLYHAYGRERVKQSYTEILQYGLTRC